MEILAPLSSGGMGEILLGRRRGAHGFEKLVAVKRIRADFVDRSDIRAMFLDEARLLARLSHPGIAQIYDFGETGDGALFIVMEYVPGAQFAELLGLGEAKPALSARLVAEVCRGLHAAHELADLDGRRFDIVHRDVTPENLVLGFDGGVKILDFGIALMRDRMAPVTQVGSIRGKAAYLAPEQLRGEAIDRRTDVYGASAVLYELIAGRRCFVDRSFSVVPFGAIDVECPPLLEALVLRGLAPDPRARFADARQMAEALERIANDLGASADFVVRFAERALAEKREAHAARLKVLLGGTESAAATLPRSARVTEVDGPAEPPPAPPPNTTLVLARPKRWPLYVGTGAAIALIAAVITLRAPPPVAQTPEVVAVQPETVLPEPEPKREPEPVRETKPASKPRTKSGSKVMTKPEPEPPPLVKAEPARLTVGANPYALVYVDGKEVGATPIELSITAGEHHIRCIEPDTDKVRFDQKITVTAGEHKRLTIR